MENLLARLEILRNMSERWTGLTHYMGNLGDVATAIYDISVKVRAAQQSVYLTAPSLRSKSRHPLPRVNPQGAAGNASRYE